ncbi:MAG: hypothetical protein U0X39_11735 [Bacteroidales bacterium]
MNKIMLMIAGVLMIFVGALRGFGGLILLSNPEKSLAAGTFSASPAQIVVIGIGLVIIMVLLIVTAYSLITKQTRWWWVASWVVLGLFLLDGLLNGFLLFGKPNLNGQSINFTAALLVAVNLMFGREALKG